MFIFNILRSCLFVACIATISGCGSSVYSHRESNPVVVDNPDDANFWGTFFGARPTSFTTFSTTASRRMVVVRQNHDEMEICSEPSPDVGEAFASAVADAITAKAPIAGVPIDFSNQYAHAVSTQIASLIYRTQGLQLYRDAMHNLCVDRMNKWGDGDSYKSLREHYFDKSVELIEKELGKIKEVSIVKAGENSSIDQVVDLTVKLLNAAKPAQASEPKPATTTK